MTQLFNSHLKWLISTTKWRGFNLKRKQWGIIPIWRCWGRGGGIKNACVRYIIYADDFFQKERFCSFDVFQSSCGKGRWLVTMDMTELCVLTDECPQHCFLRPHWLWERVTMLSSSMYRRISVSMCDLTGMIPTLPYVSTLALGGSECTTLTQYVSSVYRHIYF